MEQYSRTIDGQIAAGRSAKAERRWGKRTAKILGAASLFGAVSAGAAMGAEVGGVGTAATGGLDGGSIMLGATILLAIGAGGLFAYNAIRSRGVRAGYEDGYSRGTEHGRLKALNDVARAKSD